MILLILQLLASVHSLARGQAAFANVEDVPALLQALEDGVQHIVVSKHLNLAQITSLDVVFDVRDSTQSIRVRILCLGFCVRRSSAARLDEPGGPSRCFSVVSHVSNWFCLGQR